MPLHSSACRPTTAASVRRARKPVGLSFVRSAPESRSPRQSPGRYIWQASSGRCRASTFTTHPFISSRTYRDLGFASGSFPESEAYGDTAITLPLYPAMTRARTGSRRGCNASGPAGPMLKRPTMTIGESLVSDPADLATLVRQSHDTNPRSPENRRPIRRRCPILGRRSLRKRAARPPSGFRRALLPQRDRAAPCVLR